LIGCHSHTLNLAVKRWLGIDGRAKTMKVLELMNKDIDVRSPTILPDLTVKCVYSFPQTKVDPSPFESRF
jgi:hypothetical protein